MSVSCHFAPSTFLSSIILRDRCLDYNLEFSDNSLESLFASLWIDYNLAPTPTNKPTTPFS